MKENGIASIISLNRESIRNYLTLELKKRGVEGILSTHGTVLFFLYENSGKLSMKDISRYTGRKKTTITDLVRKLETYGYITKEESEEDKRFSYAVLTKKAYEFKPIFDEISKNLLDKIYKGFSSEDKQQAIDLLLKINHNLN